MAFSKETFLKRLRAGKSWSLIYDHPDHQGLVEVWKFGDSFILTWEECPHGKQFDESEYTKDERYQFNSSEQLFAFLAQHGLDIKLFKP